MTLVDGTRTRPFHPVSTLVNKVPYLTLPIYQPFIPLPSYQLVN